MLPMPMVVAFDGPCSRVKKSGMRTRPSEPISEKPAPATTSPATIHSNSVAMSMRPLPLFDDVAARQELRQHDGGDEAEHRDQQRGLVVAPGAELQPVEHQHRRAVHVEGVEREDAV